MEKQELPKRKSAEPEKFFSENEDKVIKEKEKQKNIHPTRQRKLSIQFDTSADRSASTSPRKQSTSSSRSTVSVRKSDIKLTKYDEKSVFAVSNPNHQTRRQSIKKKKIDVFIEEANENEDENGPRKSSIDELKAHLKNFVKIENANETDRLLQLYTISISYLFGIVFLLVVLSSINIFLPFDASNELTSHIAFDTIIFVFLVLIGWMAAYFKDQEFVKRVMRTQRFQNLRNAFLEKEITELNYTIAQNAI